MNTDVRAQGEFLRRYLLSSIYRRRLRVLQQQAKEEGLSQIPVTMLNGMTIMVNPNEFIGKRIIRHGTYSFEDIFLLSELAKRFDKAGVILDIGANIGNHSLHFSNHFQKVFAFEPNPDFIQQLQHNLTLNAINNVCVFALGLSDENAELPYHTASEDNPGASGFIQDERLADKILSVRCGDEFLQEQNITNVDVIKLDVEGFEAKVLAGLQKTIQREQPIILFEYVPEHTAVQGGFAAVRKQLEGYDIYQSVFAHKKQPFGRLLGPLRGLKFSLHPLKDVPQDHSDLLALPKSLGAV